MPMNIDRREVICKYQRLSMAGNGQRQATVRLSPTMPIS